jgi:hypothetical protein
LYLVLGAFRLEAAVSVSDGSAVRVPGRPGHRPAVPPTSRGNAVGVPLRKPLKSLQLPGKCVPKDTLLRVKMDTEIHSNITHIQTWPKLMCLD